MPIQFTNPQSPGPNQGTEQLTHAKIIVLIINIAKKMMSRVYQYGTVDENNNFVTSPNTDWSPPSIEDVPETILGDDNVPADPAFTILAGSSVPQATFLDPGDPVNYVKLSINHPVHGMLDVWIERTYTAVKRALYEHDIDKGIIEGTIV